MQLKVKNWPFDFLAHEIAKLLEKTSGPIRILDIGSGSGHYWFELPCLPLILNNRIELNFFDAKSQSGKIGRSIQSKSINSFIGVAPTGLSKFTDSEFDLVIAFDLIEHLSKSDGYKLLYEMDRISKGIKVILTPNGYVWQPPSLNNEFNAHISGWSIKDFQETGYSKVRGMIGAKFLLGPYAIPKKNKFFLHKIIWKITSTVSFYFPKYAFSIIAISAKKQIRILEQKFD